MEKNIQNHAKLSRMKELGGKTGVLGGLDLPSAGGGTEAGVQSPQRGNCLSQRRNIKAERETADLWQPKWNENQTVLAAAIHTPDRVQVPWKAQRLEAGAIPGRGLLLTVERWIEGM